MRLLLIEDDEHKAKQITEFLTVDNKENIHSVTQKKSYQSGIKEIIKNDYEGLLLDMSMPAFDRSPNGLSTNFRHFAGRDVLMELARREIVIPTIVITQFDIFGEGQKQMDAEDLNKLLEDEFPDSYRGMVHYNASLSNWKNKLIKFLQNL